METGKTQKSPENDHSRDEIYLVGFPEAAEAQHAGSISELIQSLVPEALVQTQTVFQNIHVPSVPDVDSEDDFNLDKIEDEPQSLPDVSIGGKDGTEKAASVIIMTGHDYFSANWIQRQALSLLNRIRQQCDTSVQGKRIVLAGYGSGGIVIKQAIIIANKTPTYYNVALSIAKLVFFGAPHRSTKDIMWEDAVLKMFQEDGTCRYRDWLSEMSLVLADVVSQLSHVFYRFASKYPIANFVHGQHAVIQQFNSEFENVVPWKQDAHCGTTHGGIGDLDDCESLRRHLSPLYIPPSSHHSPAYSGHGPAASSSRAFNTLYLDALRVLAPSQWTLDEMKTLDSQEDYNELQEIYASLIDHISFKNVRGGSIQVTGPIEQDKSAVMKLLLQTIIQKSPAVVVNFTSQNRMPIKSQYDILVSFIHQIISQRPVLFLLVQSSMAELLRHITWSEQTLKGVLRSIFQQSKSVNFLILMQDLESWPLEARSWLSDIPRWFPESSQSTCTFILSCRVPDPDFTPGKLIRLDLSEERRHRQALLAYKYMQRLFNFKPLYRVSPFIKEFGFDSEPDRRKHSKESIIANIYTLKWSLASTRIYLECLFERLLLNPSATIEATLSMLPATEEQLFEYLVDSLISKSNVSPRRAKLTLTWTHLAIRPLRIEELAVATAIHMDHDKISDIESAILMDTERELHTHLSGLVTVENRSVFIDNPLIENILAKKSILDGEPPGLYGHNDITLFCLRYLGIVLGEESSHTFDEYLSFVSHNHCSNEFDRISFSFLDYACRFWPTHFLQTEAADKDLKQTVMDFLRSNASKGWFLMYHSLHEGCDPSANEAAVKVYERLMRAATTRTEAMENLDSTQSAVAMASYVGLFPLVCSLLDVKETDNQLNGCKVRRGCLERVMIFSRVTSSYYLDCVISNDDDIAVKEIFNANPKAATSQFPLHKAAWGGCSKVVQALLELLDNPAAQRNDQGRTPLHMAVLCGHLDVVRILVDSHESKGRSADDGRIDMINSQDNDLKSPLIMATELGHVEIAQFFVQSGADLALKDGTGKTVVHYAVLHSLQILNTLIAHDKHVINIKDWDDQTPLHFSAKYGVIGAATAIVEAARETNYQMFLMVYDKNHMTPLHHAAQSGHAEIAAMIMAEDDSTAEDPDKYGSLPEDVAAKHGHLAVIRAITRGKLKRGDDLLVAASSSGQTLVAEYLFQHKAILPRRLMTEAASNGWSNVIHTLLKHHADVRLPDSKGLVPLHHAAKNGQKDAAFIFLTQGDIHGEKENVDVRVSSFYINSSLYTPLHFASSKGHIEVMELLLANGANVHARTAAKKTPLHLAIGNASSIRLLLDSGAEAEAEDDNGQTPLFAAVRKGCLESVRLLLDRGASLGSFDIPSKDSLREAVRQDQASIVEELFREGRNRDATSQWEYMSLAILSKALDVLKFFVGKIPETVTMISDQNTTLLWVATRRSRSSIMLTLLLEAGSDLNHEGPEGNTPLMKAACIGNAAHVQQLVEWNADVECRNDNGDTALSLAASQHNLDVVKILIEAKAPINGWNNSQETPLYRASRFGKAEIVQRLLEAGADTSICAQDTCSPLHEAAANHDIAKSLADYGADANYQMSNGWSPLHLSASWGYPEVVQLLLERGADPNLVNNAGRTALHVAIKDNEMGVVDVILAHQGSIPVDIDKPDGEEFTAIHLAILVRSSVAAKKLIDHGAKVVITLADGTTYLDAAIEEDLPETLVALLGVDRPSPSQIPWDYQSLVAAYWRAVSKAQSKSIEALLRVNGALSKEISKEGSNGLEEYMYLRIFEEGDIVDGSLPAQFVELGLDPFKRRQGHPLSCFELGFMSKEELDMEFLDACLNSVSGDLAMGTSTLGFKELRIATEIENPNIWTCLAPLMNEATNFESDQDDWGIHHFLYQAKPRKQYTRHQKKVLWQTKTPTALVWPHMWQRIDESVETRLEILAEGLEASFSARPDDEDPVTIRANFPFPPRGPGIVYFEVSILQTMTKESARVVIGLSGEFTNQINAVPGRNMWSIGYDGVDGNVYEEGGLCDEMDECAAPYGVNQTVGCGIDYENDDYFFTCDGQVIFRKSSDIIYRKLYPSIGHCGGEAVTVRVNFGKDRFKWREANLDR